MARTLTLKDPKEKLEPLVTPCMIVNTEMGMIPCVTPDISPSIPLYLSLGDFVDNKLPKDVSIPVSLGLGERWIFLGPTTNFNNFDEGPSKDGIKISCRNGVSRSVNKDEYQKIIDSVQPNAVISLYSPVLPDASSRQKKLRITSTIELATKYPNVINFTHELCDSNIETAPNQPEKDQELIKNTGVFFHYGEITKEAEENIAAKIALRDSSLPRMILCDGHPADVRKCYKLGIDIFLFNLPYVAARRGIAMNFDFESTEYKEIGIDLKSKEFEHDHTPVVEGCDCPCCKQFTRSYLYHLLEVHEMLSGTLLVQHNIRHYQRYLESLRNQLTD